MHTRTTTGCSRSFTALAHVAAAAHSSNEFSASKLQAFNIWIGSIANAMNEAELERRGIATVVCAARGLMTVQPCTDDSHTHRYASLELADSPNQVLVTPELDEALAIIDPHGAPVLVFCAQGRSRSVAVVAAALMRRAHMSRAEALDAIYAVRPSAQINLGFFIQLASLASAASAAPVDDSSAPR